MKNNDASEMIKIMIPRSIYTLVKWIFSDLICDNEEKNEEKSGLYYFRKVLWNNEVKCRHSSGTLLFHQSHMTLATKNMPCGSSYF